MWYQLNCPLKCQNNRIGGMLCNQYLNFICSSYNCNTWHANKSYLNLLGEIILHIFVKSHKYLKDTYLHAATVSHILKFGGRNLCLFREMQEQNVRLCYPSVSTLIVLNVKYTVLTDFTETSTFSTEFIKVYFQYTCKAKLDIKINKQFLSLV